MADKECGEPKSRTRKKKEAHLLQEMGEKLVHLSPQQLADMPLPEELAEEIQFAGTLTRHGAYRRQIQRIGALMREIDPEPITRALAMIALGDCKRSQAFHQLEQWRDTLIEGDDELLEEIVSSYKRVDRQRLTQLVRSAKKERQKNRSKKSARNLFAYLRQIQNAGLKEEE
jgi:ribosome-associated protein